MGSITQYLVHPSIAFPDNISVIDRTKRYSYREIDTLSDQIAAALSKKKVHEGDRICLVLPNSVHFVYSFFGILKAGSIPVPVSPLTPPGKLAEILLDVGAVACIGDETNIRKLDHNSRSSLLSTAFGQTASSTFSKHISYLSLQNLAGNSNNETNAKMGEADAIAVILYTSGTTGRPKGVKLSGRNIDFATSFMIQSLGLTPEDRTLITIDFSHCAGLLHLLANVKCGGTVTVGLSVALPGGLLRHIKLESVTGFPTVPPAISLLLKGYRKEFIEHCSALRYIELSSAPYTSKLIGELFRSLPGIEIYNTYGLTEVPRITYHRLMNVPETMLSVGKEHPLVRVDIVDSNQRSCSVGNTGEILVSGPNVVPGYWNREEEEKKRFTEGAYSTGDIGYRDRQGRLFLLGRQDDMIKSGAERIYPAEIEQVIGSMDGVQDEVVYEIQDDIYGGIIKARIVASTEDVTEKGVVRFCREHIERYKVPQVVEFCSSLPKTELGKVDRNRLK